MKVFNTIIGIFAIFASVYCIWFPGVFFIRTGWIVTILLGAWGACALFDTIFKHSAKSKEGKWNVTSAILAVLAAIAAAAVSLTTIFMPGLSAILDLTVIYILVFWLIVSGFGSIIMSVTVGRKSSGKKWIWTLILGILVLISGLYGIYHIIAMAQTIGLLLGLLLMLYGVRLIGSIFE